MPSMRPPASPWTLPRPKTLPTVAAVPAIEGSPPATGLYPDRTAMPGYTPPPTPWDIGEQLGRIEEKLDRLLELQGGR